MIFEFQPWYRILGLPRPTMKDKDKVIHLQTIVPYIYIKKKKKMFDVPHVLGSGKKSAGISLWYLCMKKKLQTYEKISKS